MIGDETRREVAAELRALDVSDIEVDGRIIDSPKYVGLLLMRMLEVVCDYRDGLHYFPAFFSARTVVELFADLIDRPTCRNVSGCQDVFECSECRCRVELIAEVCNEYGEPFSVPLMPSFCPNCGAKVTAQTRKGR